MYFELRCDGPERKRFYATIEADSADEAQSELPRLMKPLGLDMVPAGPPRRGHDRLGWRMTVLQRQPADPENRTVIFWKDRDQRDGSYRSHGGAGMFALLGRSAEFERLMTEAVR